MNLNIEMSEEDLKKFILRYFQEKLGTLKLEPTDIKIEVKSKQNYKSEWEEASFRAKVSKYLLG